MLEGDRYIEGRAEDVHVERAVHDHIEHPFLQGIAFETEAGHFAAGDHVSRGIVGRQTGWYTGYIRNDIFDHVMDVPVNLMRGRYIQQNVAGVTATILYHRSVGRVGADVESVPQCTARRITRKERVGTGHPNLIGLVSRLPVNPIRTADQRPRRRELFNPHGKYIS